MSGSNDILRLPRPVAFLLLALATYNALGFAVTALVACFPLPAYDMIDFLDGYLRQGLGWPWLLTQSNTHLTPLPRLFMALDLALTGGHILSYTSLSLLFCGGGYFLLLRMLRPRSLPAPWPLLLPAALALICFRAFALEFMVIPNGYNYPMLGFFALAALCLAAAGDKPWVDALAALSALAASLCLSSGLLLFPLLLLALLLRRAAAPAYLPASLSAALAFALYLRAPGSAVEGDLSPWLGADIALHLLGSPWILKSRAIGYLAGGLLLLASLGALAWLVLQGRRLDRAGRLALLCLCFGLGCVGAVAVGRQEFGAAIGTSGRYALFTIFVHIGLILTALCLPLLRRPRALRAVLPGLLFGALLLTAEQAALDRFYFRLGAEVARQAEALRAGARDPALFTRVHSNSAYAAGLLDRLAERQWFGLGRPGAAP